MASPVSHPLISVIVPAYNVGEKLEETLRSLAGQGPKDDSRFEFLIVDDGSRDNTLEVAKAFAATDPRFKVLHQRNRVRSGAQHRSRCRGRRLGRVPGR